MEVNIVFKSNVWVVIFIWYRTTELFNTLIYRSYVRDFMKKFNKSFASIEPKLKYRIRENTENIVWLKI